MADSLRVKYLAKQFEALAQNLEASSAEERVELLKGMRAIIEELDQLTLGELDSLQTSKARPKSARAAGRG